MSFPLFKNELVGTPPRFMGESFEYYGFFQSLGQESCKLVNWHPTLEKVLAFHDFVDSANDFFCNLKSIQLC